MKTIKSQRKALGLNQSQFAKLVGVFPNSIQRYETSTKDRRFPPIKIAKRICSLLKEHGLELTLDEIYHDISED